MTQAATMTEQASDKCAVCGELIDFRPGETFMASTDGKVWHMGCAPSRQGSAALPSEAMLAEIIHNAMVYAVREFRGEPQPWQNGNSTAESYARREARDVIEAMRAATPTPDTGLIEALEPFALLAGGDVNMSDPLSKWFTVAHLQNARESLDTALANAAPAQPESGVLLDAINNQLLEGETAKALVPSRKARLELCAEACRAFNQATKGDGL